MSREEERRPSEAPSSSRIGGISGYGVQLQASEGFGVRVALVGLVNRVKPLQFKAFGMSFQLGHECDNLLG